MMPQRYRTRVVANRRISPEGYELTLERGGLPFDAGRLLTLHGADPTEDRSYTIASGERDEHLQVLYCLIPTGKLTPQLVKLQAGDPVDFSGPYGEFVVRDPERPLVFVATGTGVAPCRAYVRSHPGLDVTLVHGARTVDELYYREELAPATNYHPCVTREPGDAFQGRVTDFLPGLAIDPGSHFYLCGANEMIFDVHELLRARDVDDARIFTEAYYYSLSS